MVSLLGIRLSGATKSQALAKITGWLKGGHFHYVVTPNPEILLAATRDHDEELFYILNQANLSLADGTGLKFAAWLYGKRLPRVTGADLIKPLLEVAAEQGKKVLFILWSKGLSRPADITFSLKEKYPNLIFEIKEIDREENIDTGLTADIMLVALGAPYQEKFIFHQGKKIAGLKVAIGIGGALDFITKKAKRAPKIWRVVGLEWLWRLIKQPKRWKRMFKAVIVFPYDILVYRFIMPHLYRPNVACLLYKKVAGKYQILIVERTLDPGHWQLPQGGTDGLDIKSTGIKELNEEIGNNKFKIMAVYDFLYRYKFDSSLGKFPNQRHTGYKGQKQALVIAEYLGRDDEIKINFWDHSAFKFVPTDELLTAVHPLRRSSTEIYLNKFKEII